MTEVEGLPPDEPLEPPPGAVHVEARGRELHYHFPVEIVVVGAVPPEERETLMADVWTGLDTAIG